MKEEEFSRRYDGLVLRWLAFIGERLVKNSESAKRWHKLKEENNALLTKLYPKPEDDDEPTDKG